MSSVSMKKKEWRYEWDQYEWCGNRSTVSVGNDVTLENAVVVRTLTCEIQASRKMICGPADDVLRLASCNVKNGHECSRFWLLWDV